MKDQSFSYRIVKIGGKAAAVALTAFGLLAGAAQATDVYLGTAFGKVAASDGSTATSATWHPGDYWVNVVNPTDSYGTATSRGGDLFYGTNVIYGNVNGNAYIDYPWGGNPVTGAFGYLDDSSPRAGINAVRQSTYIANSFGNIVSGEDGPFHFGAGVTVNNSSRGEKAYAQGSYGPGGGWSISVNSGQAAGAVTNYAINLSDSWANFYGNNTINGDVNTWGNYIYGSNVVFNSRNVSGDLYFENAGTVYFNGLIDLPQSGLTLDGSVDFQNHNGVLNMANNTRILSDVSANSIANATLNFEGSGKVGGKIGPIKTINVLGNKSRVELNTDSGSTTVGSISYSADQAAVEVYGKLTGNVNLNGHYSKLELLDRNGTATGGANGMNGVLDFGMHKSNQALAAPDTYGQGTLEIGNNVNVTFNDDPTKGIQLTNADNATVVFAGNSTVTGDLGSADASKHNTPNKIYAGATNGGTGGTVTFQGRVYVGAGNLNIGPSNNTVVLNGGLTGNLEFGTGTPVSMQGTAYTNYGDGGVNGTWGNAGTVELAHNQTITGSITTITNGTGNMKFMGSSAYANNIGASGLKLASVVFNAATAGTSAAPVQSTIAGDVWANQVTIGNGNAHTNATLTAGAHQLGDALTLAGVNTTLNLMTGSSTQTANTTTHSALVSNLSKNADGTLANAGTSRATVGSGGITTNGAAINFAVDAGAVSARTGAIVAASSGTLSTSGNLSMTGAEKINVTLLGSMNNGQTLKLIDATGAGTTNTALTTAAKDNSFVIDTAVAQTGGDLVFSASRANNQYITKSATTGHFSNAAALRLGTLAANGSANGSTYTGDMQTVFNKLDLNEWGYGNNEVNLAKQVKRLAPISNGAITQSAMDAGTLALNTMGNRMASLRADNAPVGIAGPETEGRDGQWVKLVGNNSKQKTNGSYDGYSANTTGLVWGADTRIDNDALLGLGLSVTNTRINQSDFRTGDNNAITSYQLAGYGAYQFTEALYGEASLSYARHNITGSRMTALDRVANADYSANQFTGRLGIGYRFVLDDKQTLTPMLNLESSSLSSDAYKETGADALNLKLNSQKLTRNRMSLGLRYLAESKTDAGTVYRPELTAAIYRDGSGTSKNTVAAFEGDLTGNTFSTTNLVPGRSGYNLSAGVSILNSKTSLVQLQLGYDHRQGFESYSARVKARWDF